MSLYNLVMGFHPTAHQLVSMLQLVHPSMKNKDELLRNYGGTLVERFRDAYLIRNEDGELRITVMTRTGGPNRETFKDNIESLRKHHLYIMDWDDKFDQTFAYFVFTIPPQFKEWCENLAKEFGLRGNPIQEMMQKAGKIGDQSQEGEELRKKLAPLLKSIAKTLSDGGGKIIVEGPSF